MRKALAIAALAAAVSTIALPSVPARGQIRAPAAVEKPIADQQAVPVKQVVLYTSGVGYFEHYGMVKGDGFTELHFKTAQINDILKSLLLEDLDKGKISSVIYSSQEPLAHALKSFQVDLSAAPPLNELLAQLRGASVTANTASGQITGQILSVEKKQKPGGDRQVIEVSVLNLLLPAGSIRPLELDQITEIKLDDAKLQQELVKALAAVAASRDQDSKAVAIRFTGQGERRVRIGYVVEAPVWKASYRLVLTDESKNELPPTAKPDPAKKNEENKGGKLQGWAIVENQTDSDWENIQLSLVSGRPISFIEDLYQPLFTQRPVVEPELYASLRPQNYAQGMDRLARQLQEGKATAPPGAYKLADQAAPIAAAASATRLDAAHASGNLAVEALDPTASVSSLASGASVGEFFQYTVGDVSLPRQKSAMIPIVTDELRATRLSIYNASVLPDHPLLGARITNATGKLLPQGPITVLEGGAYAGDASIQDLPNTQSRLLSYGIDQSLLVHDNDQTQNSTLVTGKVVKGILELTYKQIFRQNYTAQNKGKTDRTLLIEHPRRSGWLLAAPAAALETTDTLYRFEEVIPAGESKTLAIQQELVSSQDIAILPMDTAQIELYLRAGQIPDDVKKSLQQAAKLKSVLVDTQRQVQDRQQQINEITQEQNRIRNDMKAVSPSDEYYKRLEKKLDAQETQIEKLNDELKTLRQAQEAEQKDLENYLQGLNVG